MPGIIEVTAKKNEAEATINYDFGENLEEMTELFGDSVTFTNARSNMKIVLQAAMRRRLEAGPIAAAKAKYATMSDEEKAAFLEDLRSL
jgi:hypothetical protein